MAATLRERRRQLLRDEILDAAHTLMAERGYAAMSMEELAARAGVSKPTLYSQFPAGKEDLIVAMVSRLMEHVFADLPADQPGHSPLERLARLLYTIVHLQIEGRATAMQLFLPEILALLERHPRSREQLIRVDHVVVELAQQAAAAGELDPALDVASVVRVFYALICSPNVAPLSAIGTPDASTMADAVVAIFRRGVSPAKA